MSVRTVLVVLLALVFGGSAAVGINNYVQRDQDPTAPKGDTVPVVVATAEVQRGKSLTADLLATKDYPKDLVPAGAITKKEDALDRTVAVPLAKDEPLFESKLASKSAGRGLAALVPDGMRACTITTTLSSALAGLLVPGNRVDVILTISTGQNNDPTGGASTTTLLQNVEILAVDHHIEAPAETKGDPNVRTVTLVVTPDQAAMVELGQAKVTLSLTLRGPADTKAANTRPATLADIQFHQEKPDPVIPPAAPVATIRTIRGTAEGQVEVARPDDSPKGP